MPAANRTKYWRGFEPSARTPWNHTRTEHLWRRAGFGAPWSQLQASLRAGPNKTIDGLLKSDAAAAEFNRTCDEYAQAADSADALRAWWLRRMILTPDPLREKMTLFWHDFFAASGSRGPSGPQMRAHMAILRKNALGNFATLLTEVMSDPATLLSLETAINGTTTCGGAFARELLARYTVGDGNFSKEDVRQTVRAMSGWRLARNRRRYFKDHHDGREKTILGKSGKFGFDDAVKIAVNNPKTARNIAARLYRFFISETDEPTEAILAPLAESFARDLDIKRLVETILRSERFFSDAVIGRRIKRPVEYAVGIIRGLEANVSAAKLAEDLAAMGENLYHPPTPNGWLGGRSWINTATMIARSNLAKSLLSDSGPYGGKCDPAALTKRHGHTDIKSAARFLASLFFAPGQTIEESLKLLPVIGGLSDRLRTFAYRLMTRPEFQLA